MPTADVTVVIVSHNDLQHLEECLSSLSVAASSGRAEVVVVDNASTDGSREMVGGRFPFAKLVAMEENSGFSRANNAGIRAGRAGTVLILNPDTTLDGGVLETLLKTMEDDPRLGAVGPVLFNARNRCQVSFGRGRGFFSELAQKWVLNPWHKARIRTLRRPVEVKWLSGACLLVRRSVLDAVGLFDERYFLYFEDIDLCYRIGRAGWKLALQPGARVFHAGGASTRSRPLFSRFHYRRSQVLFYRSHNSKLSQSLLRLYLSIGFSLSLLASLVRRAGDISERKRFFRLLRREGIAVPDWRPDGPNPNSSGRGR